MVRSRFKDQKILITHYRVDKTDGVILLNFVFPAKISEAMSGGDTYG